MPSFGKSSLQRLNECHPNLQIILNEAIKELDFTILCGHRGEDEQNQAFAEKKSQVKFPNSKHNSMPSMAADIALYPINWNDIAGFNKLMDKVQEIADKKGIKIRLGRSFSFKDYPHVELM
jgi:peptidoglycan LD-endopeptidase CwlK